MTQKKDIKRQKEKLEIWKRDYEEEKSRAREAAHDRVLLEFEKSQLGLAGRPTDIGTKSGTTNEEGVSGGSLIAMDSLAGCTG